MLSVDHCNRSLGTVVLYRSSARVVRIPAAMITPIKPSDDKRPFEVLNILPTRVRHSPGKEEEWEFQFVALLWLQRYLSIERGANPLPQVPTASFSTAGKNGSYHSPGGSFLTRPKWDSVPKENRVFCTPATCGGKRTTGPYVVAEKHAQLRRLSGGVYTGVLSLN